MPWDPQIILQLPPFFPPDFCSFYNILKNCRGHNTERSVFSERTEESSAVQYFQVGDS